MILDDDGRMSWIDVIRLRKLTPAFPSSAFVVVVAAARHHAL
jgi:hypothetical protein